MKTLKMTILSLSALIIFLAPGQLQAGETKIKFRAGIRTPLVRVDVSNSIRRDKHDQRHGVQSRHFRHHSKKDRKMAARLSDYSGFSQYRFLKMRDRGMRWSEIAYRLDLSKRVVRAASSAKSWRAYFRPVHRCGTIRH